MNNMVNKETGKVNIYDQSGESVGNLKLNPEIFAVRPRRSDLVHEIVTGLRQQARGPVAATKTRGKVRGGGRKPWRQKGTGRARAGSIRSPIWRGGGVTFGPSAERNFKKRINKKTKRLGLLISLSDKIKHNRVLVLDKFELQEGKTRELIGKLQALMEKFKFLGRQVLIILPDRQEKLFRAAKNLPNFKVRQVNSLSILDVISADGLIILKDALPVIEKTYLKS